MSVASGQFYEETFVCTTSVGFAGLQWTLVAFTTSPVPTNGRTAIVPCTSTTNGVNACQGIIQDTPAVGTAGTVRMLGLGTSKVQATTSAAVTVGSPITCTTGGNAMVADTTGQRVIGHCILGSTGLVAGSTIEVLLNGPYPFGLG